MNGLNSHIKQAYSIQYLPVLHSVWITGHTGVLICFHFVHMNTLVPEESTQLLESSDLNLCLILWLRSNKFATLDKSLNPMKCYFMSL